ncbi:ATP-dependent nuclease [Herbaspirillum rubrisubalbicans]|uniref:ATP-dependent nuclease n=1 Tax=Herbaspirillum rubrisubalbicans TaxID=80842 RepID=UPI0015585461|nr:AAA family ATPase [Herbaspirillum rubrisubalbicans]
MEHRAVGFIFNILYCSCPAIKKLEGKPVRVKIERFKSLDNVELDLSGITLLVGGNNAGKSSVLQAIQFGASVAQTSAMQGGNWREDRVATSIGQSDLVYSPIKDVLSLGRNGRLREPQGEAINITYIDGQTEAKVSVRKGRNRNVVLELVGGDLGSRLQSITNPLSTLVTGLAGIPSEEEYETTYVVRKAAAMGDSNGVFRNILFQLKADEQKWTRFQDQIRRIFPDYSLDVFFDPESDESIQCIVIRNGVTYPIDSCGTGVLQAIQIFSYIHLFQPKILLLDEPDSHLHPNNQKQLAKELIDSAEAGLNVVISTHSRHLVEALWENARLVWLKDGAVEPDVENYQVKALLEIGALNVGERLGNPQYIFFTEDEDHGLIEILLQANGFDLGECDIVSYSGCTQVGTAMALIAQLRKQHARAKYVVHRDRDFMTTAEISAYKAKFAALNVSFLIPDRNDLESYFVTDDHIAATCNIDVEVATAITGEAFNNRRDAMISKYVNTRAELLRKNGEQPNSGQLAVEAFNQLNGPNSMAIHGKILLKGIRDVLQERRIADRLLSSSAALACADLIAILANQGAQN